MIAQRATIPAWLVAALDLWAPRVAAMVGAVICGTFGAGFLMAGYASLHKRARGKDWRLPVLILAYLSAVFVFPLFIILVFGLSDVRSTISLTPTRKTDNTNETKP